MNVQVNVMMPDYWKKQLEQIARVMAAKEERSISYPELVRRAVKEKYKLKDEEKDEK